jgi:hypothetical protein
MRQFLVMVTWESEHLVELADDADPADLVRLLAGQSNVRMVGYTAQPLDEVLDAAVDRLLGSDGDAGADAPA